jgi:nitrite reductase (NO-forming)
MLRRIGSLVALLLVATVVLAACGTQDDKVEPTVTRIAVEGAPSDETAEGGEEPAAEQPSAGEMTIDVEMVDIAFTQTEITVPANYTITVNLKNSGAAMHNFHIDELGVKSPDVPGGESATFTFNSGAPGEYEFFCAVPGHREAGMVGKLIVTGDVGEGGEAPVSAAASPAAEASPVAAASPVVAAETPATTEEAPASAAQTEFDVSMVDIAFEQTELVVPANSEITINLTNNGVAVHNMHIEELGVASPDLAGGESATFTFNSGAPGEYEYFCAVPGHREAGMVGKLIVQ